MDSVQLPPSFSPTLVSSGRIHSRLSDESFEGTLMAAGDEITFDLLLFGQAIAAQGRVL